VADSAKHQGGGREEEFREGTSAHGKSYPGPSTGAPPGAIEGSIMEDDAEEKRTEGSRRDTTGAGAEAAEGIHATEGRNQHDKSAVTNKEIGRDASGIRAGSEPIDREKEHKGSYGGEGGEPRSGSHERERH
jgi:hypothetical protein